MTWGLPQRDLPILSPGQMNPFNQALSSGLDTYQNLIKNSYLPQQLQADIASKAAYATYTPYSYLTKILSDPTALAALSNNPEQLKALFGRLGNIPSDPYASLHAGRQQQRESILDKLKSLVGLNESKEVPRNNEQIQNMQPGNVIPQPRQPLRQPEAPQDENGPYRQSPIASTSPGGGTPKELLGSRYAELFPLSQQGIQQKAQQVHDIKQAETYNKMWGESLEKSSDDAKASGMGLQTLEDFDQAYKKLHWYERGPIAGEIKKIRTSAAQETDNASEKLAAVTARAIQSGHINPGDRVIARSLKVSRDMSPEAEQDILNKQKAILQRDVEYNAFQVAAKNKNLTQPEANIIWNKYIDEKPLFNRKTKELNNDNLSSWPEYLQNSKINKILNPSVKNKQMENISNAKSMKLENHPISQGAKALAKNLVLPEFSSKEEFHRYFNSLDPMSQDAIRLHLSQKKKGAK